MKGILANAFGAFIHHGGLEVVVVLAAWRFLSNHVPHAPCVTISRSTRGKPQNLAKANGQDKNK